MTIYEIIHVTYSDNDNDYDITDSILFSSYKDAIQYFHCMIDNVIDEYLLASGYNTIEEFDDYNGEGYYYLMNCDDIEPESEVEYDWPKLIISLEEYGSDTVRMYKRNIMSFN